jgi:hypothetical protein
MERFIQYLKDRRECFDDDHFPCRKKNCDKDSMYVELAVEDVLSVFVYGSADRIRFTMFLIGGDSLS